MAEFARLCCQEDAIWLEQGEDELETILRDCMGTLVDEVMATRSVMSLSHGKKGQLCLGLLSKQISFLGYTVNTSVTFGVHSQIS